MYIILELLNDYHSLNENYRQKGGFIIAEDNKINGDKQKEVYQQAEEIQLQPMQLDQPLQLRIDNKQNFINTRNLSDIELTRSLPHRKSSTLIISAILLLAGLFIFLLVRLRMTPIESHQFIDETKTKSTLNSFCLTISADYF